MHLSARISVSVDLHIKCLALGSKSRKWHFGSRLQPIKEKERLIIGHQRERLQSTWTLPVITWVVGTSLNDMKRVDITRLFRIVWRRLVHYAAVNKYQCS